MRGWTRLGLRSAYSEALGARRLEPGVQGGHVPAFPEYSSKNNQFVVRISDVRSHASLIWLLKNTVRKIVPVQLLHLNVSE